MTLTNAAQYFLRPAEVLATVFEAAVESAQSPVRAELWRQSHDTPVTTEGLEKNGTDRNGESLENGRPKTVAENFGLEFERDVDPQGRALAPQPWEGIGTEYMTG